MADELHTDRLTASVLEAFSRALSSGKSDWYEMLPAVFKNRLLDVTDRTFDEHEWGVSSVSAIPSVIPEVLELEQSPTGRLTIVLTPIARRSVTESADVTHGPAERIRSDLWEAVVNFRASTTWVWDTEESVARPIRQSDYDGDPKVLPTISAEGLVGWRQEFIDANPDLTENGSNGGIREWVERGYAGAGLPSRMRGDWFRFLKTKVAEVLRNWFSATNTTPPETLLANDTERRRPDSPTEQLRHFILRAVDQMSDEELKSLSLPAAAMLRVR